MADKTHETQQTKPAATKQCLSVSALHEADTTSHAGLDVTMTLADPYLANPAQVLALQHIVGNHAVSRLIQAKLAVGPAHDRYEQEADRVAQRVMAMPAPAQHPPALQRAPEDEEEVQMKPLAASITPLVQRQAAPEEEEIQAKPLVQRQAEEDEEEVQAKPIAQRLGEGGFEVNAAFEQQLAASHGGGRPLPGTVREFMEPRFGADFSSVRVHTGGEAAQLNRSVSAQAFTLGKDIYLGEGKTDLESPEGKKLLAHELTHVVQQSEAASSIQSKEAIQKHPAPYLAEDEEDTVRTKRDTSTIQRYSASAPSQPVGKGLVHRLSTRQPKARQIQRAFQPATTLEKTHLRSSTGAKVHTGTKIGRNIPAGAEIVVDKASQYTQTRKIRSNVTWTRAIDVPAANWDPNVHPAQGGYIRDAKIQTTPYPQATSVFITFRGDLPCQKQWRADIGEYLDIEDSKAYPGSRIVQAGKTFYRLPAGGPPLVPLNILEKTQVETSEYTLFGPSPSDPLWLIITPRQGNPLKYKPSTHEEDLNPVLTQEETTAIKEQPIKKHMETELAKDPQMQAGLLTTTTIPYVAGLGIAPVNVYVKGNAAAELYDDQLDSVRKGLHDLAAKHVLLKDGLEIYISSSDRPLQAAYNFGPGRIVLKSTMFNNPELDVGKSATEGIRGGVATSGVFGVAHQIANQFVGDKHAKKLTLGGAVAVHETGHVMHKLTSPAIFQQLQKNDLSEDQLRRLSPAAKQVSQYAATAPGDGNKALELVAEVFTGITYDQKYPRDVIDLYKELGGYKLWGEDKEVVA